ncbi:putative monovalent cation/H+ antiporter subunit G [Gordonia polyisoprenivorans VH2]|uniref:Monovalent cation/H(+) antiporter subunit G n=2 Tax=Gordonia polyisoprenivorans TaxID=84595 RepID=A0A846WI61_9ACTN|nr:MULTISPECIES: monovalent cation/H(+) antiporter subunit G [Gordonia]AFA71887.1 putative monovalent cation/H+ antiporter subunit G [Gordonia polyisoprenivorans VH2]MBE7192220.1 monovalent cation/H(+) antiporter subunit G [Gordonia polyisoprenivorans]MDF3280690.1 monovalent cation/H(+) antiporter subunit G [Gordonia sp. N1V]NKY00081.1 monovalent cation/H(+) antiporter subunit G [Gordonia polyisoprenivorans]OPX12303.1 cation:proton antiporter [Gordonia sp. i37]
MIADIVSAVFLTIGALMAVTAAIGILRFPDTLSRMHSATKPQTLGLLMMLIGAMVSIGGTHVDMGMLVLAGLFALITAPVVAHRIGRLVYQEQRAQDGLMSRDQMERGDRD